MHRINNYNYYYYEGRSINSRTVLLSKHRVIVKDQNSYEVVRPLLYITYCGIIHDVTLLRNVIIIKI